MPDPHHPANRTPGWPTPGRAVRKGLTTCQFVFGSRAGYQGIDQKVLLLTLDSVRRSFVVVEDAVAVRRRWNELNERSRRLIMLGAVFEGILKIAALIDLVRRPASQIRGAKWQWATAVTLVNSGGGVPLAYFLFGRRKSSG